jgi:hypothetical protein
VSACKVALALVVLLFTPQPAIMLAIVAFLLLALASTTWHTKPCRDVASVNVLRFGFHGSALLAVGCAALALHLDDAANDLPAVVFIGGHAVLLSALAVLFACRRNFCAYDASPLQASTVKTDSGSSSSTGAAPNAASSPRKAQTSSAAQKSASSSSAEMESGLLGAAALELVALPSHSAAAAANGGDVSSSLRVSAVLDTVFSEGGGEEEGGGYAGGSVPGSSSSAGATMAREAVAAAIQKSKTEAKAKATEFLESELMGFMGSLGFA